MSNRPPAVVVGAVLLSLAGESAFARYFGPVHPVVAVALVSAAGLLALRRLARHDFVVRRPGVTFRGVRLAAGLATLFGAIAVGGDLVFRFPPDINVAPPNGLVFYPVMGLVAEVVFRLVPLALLLEIPGFVGDAGRRVVPAMVAAALAEPVFQVAIGGAAAAGAGSELFVSANVFAICLAELVVFRRYDFVSAFALWLVYYGWWHIIWGHLRLQLLF